MLLKIKRTQSNDCALFIKIEGKRTSLSTSKLYNYNLKINLKFF